MYSSNLFATMTGKQSVRGHRHFIVYTYCRRQSDHYLSYALSNWRLQKQKVCIHVHHHIDDAARMITLLNS
jgi:hypothetical protein